MAWILCFLALLNCCSGVKSQPKVIQPISESVSLGRTSKLSCSGSSDIRLGSFNWFQQRPGQRPRFLFYSSTNRGEGVPDRFTGSVSQNVAYLTITSIQAEDEADYYCCAWYNAGKMYIFGGGTSLSVIGQPVTPPTVRVFPPSPEEITTKNTATLVCLIEGFYPASTNVAWSADGTDITRNVETAKPTKQGEKYVSSSYLTMTAPEYNSHDNYKCKVTHEGKTFEQSIKRS